MNKLLLSICIIMGPFIVLSQNKKDMSVSFGVGIFNSPYYTNAYKREFYSLEFDYHLQSRHILSASFLKGSHRYYDSIHPNNAIPLNTPGYEDNANTEADYFTFSVLYKYKLIDKRISLSLGAGAGIMTQVIVFPYTEGNIVDMRQSSWTNLVFPLRIDIDYLIAQHFKAGLMSGTYVHPDYPFLGNYAGLRLSYIIK